MRRLEEPLAGCLLLEGGVFHDERGYFRRLSTAIDNVAEGLPEAFQQHGASFNSKRGTVRGLHYQAAPNLEHKLVQCVRGAIWDVMVDLRPESATYGRWFGAELSETNGRMLYSQPGFAHGFQALTDDALVLYQISPDYVAGAAGAIRWDDPDLAIPWPLPAVNVSAKDQAAPYFRQHDARLTSPAV
ncbi:dTDP-4-dehydrorhamnose 3,5-epimerase [Caulobacter endophyticus]|uniref:dTDP-4-dehydrorhamnose 3,5-epimerase n=1 Tax=Caulobacter endophyticus TaxID=2172652 RepID=UPI00240FC82C|nr:dTDP-4-dehydrorhamnose 3,5-epimerase [Caulobacter endophyticus]MDG2528802.1 dTDP-4-dehydrorhamnose 3,5-epimerase [Caulobacter endophyticus]